MKKISILHPFFLACTLVSTSNSMEEIRKKQFKLQPKSGGSIGAIAALINQNNNIIVMLGDRHTNDNINKKLKQDVVQHAPKNSFFVIEDIKETFSAVAENNFSNSFIVTGFVRSIFGSVYRTPFSQSKRVLSLKQKNFPDFGVSLFEQIL